VPPGAPTGLGALVAGGNVTLNWTAAGGCAATSFIVEAGSASGLADLAVLNTGSTLPTFLATAPSGTYFVRVRATNAFGTSAPSNEVVIVVP
jgi:hypothetical protein